MKGFECVVHRCLIGDRNARNVLLLPLLMMRRRMMTVMMMVITRSTETQSL